MMQAPHWHDAALHALHQPGINQASEACEQVRAGEGESEAAGTVLTNPVWKTSTYSGLSTRGRAQVCLAHLLGWAFAMPMLQAVRMILGESI